MSGLPQPPHGNAPKVEWARWAAEVGRITRAFKVFRLQPERKVPPAEYKWKDEASWDDKTVAAMWIDHPRSNIGLAIQPGAVALDADVYKPGNEALLADFEATYGVLPRTLEFCSANLGYHLIYQTEKLLGNSTGNLPKFGDVRGDGGYLVGPGSTIAGKPYTVENLALPAPLPAHVDDKLTEKRAVTSAERTLPPWKMLDDPINIAGYTRWLKNDARLGDPGVDGNNTLAATGAMGSSYGLSEDVTVQLMAEHWNTRQEEPWPDEDLARYGGSGYRSAWSDFGNKAEVNFTAMQAAATGATSTPGAPRKLLMGDDMWTMLTETPVEIVQGIIGVGTLTVISGGMGAGKSAWVSSVAHAVLTGSPWFGRETRQARVMILAGEGVRRTIHDFVANCQHHGQDHREVQKHGFAVHNGALLLNTPAGIAAALERLSEFKEAFGAYPDVLVVDTARKNFRGSVSDDKDVGVFYEHINMVLGMGISVVIVAHTGKTQPGAAASGAKGSSDWEQGADYVLQMTGKVRDGETTIFFEKVKTGQDGDTISLSYVFPDVPGVGTTPVAVPKTGAGKSEPFEPVKRAPKDDAVQDNAKHKIAEDAIAYVLSNNRAKEYSWRELSIAAAHYLGEQKQEGFTDGGIKNTHLKRMSNTGHPFYQRATGRWKHATMH